jgi:hypothetical protein
MNLGGAITMAVLAALGTWFANLIGGGHRERRRSKNAEMLSLGDLSAKPSAEESDTDRTRSGEITILKGGRAKDVAMLSQSAKAIYEKYSTYNIPDHKNSLLIKKLEENNEIEAVRVIRNQSPGKN